MKIEITKILTERFWLKVTTNPIWNGSDCWIWRGACFQKGYGQFWTGKTKKKIKAHRYSWVLHNGQIPNGFYVLHKCDNMVCVKPSHLFLGTHADNVADKISKGRQFHGPNWKPR